MILTKHCLKIRVSGNRYMRNGKKWKHKKVKKTIKNTDKPISLKADKLDSLETYIYLTELFKESVIDSYVDNRDCVYNLMYINKVSANIINSGVSDDVFRIGLDTLKNESEQLLSIINIKKLMSKSYTERNSVLKTNSIEFNDIRYNTINVLRNIERNYTYEGWEMACQFSEILEKMGYKYNTRRAMYNNTAIAFLYMLGLYRVSTFSEIQYQLRLIGNSGIIEHKLMKVLCRYGYGKSNRKIGSVTFTQLNNLYTDNPIEFMDRLIAIDREYNIKDINKYGGV